MCVCGGVADQDILFVSVRGGGDGRDDIRDAVPESRSVSRGEPWPRRKNKTPSSLRPHAKKSKGPRGEHGDVR